MSARPSKPVMTAIAKISHHLPSPNFLASNAVWIFRTPSSRKNRPMALHTNIIRLAGFIRTMTPSAIRIIPEVRSCWNASR